MVRASLERVGRLYDGWFPNAPDPERWRAQWEEIHQIAREAGRDPAQLTGAVYLTLTIDEDKARAEERMNAFMQNYYGQPASVMRARQATYAGPAEGAAEWLSSWVRAGVGHLVLRFAGDAERHLEAIADAAVESRRSGGNGIKLTHVSVNSPGALHLTSGQRPGGTPAVPPGFHLRRRALVTRASVKRETSLGCGDAARRRPADDFDPRAGPAELAIRPHLSAG